MTSLLAIAPLKLWAFKTHLEVGPELGPGLRLGLGLGLGIGLKVGPKYYNIPFESSLSSESNRGVYIRVVVIVIEI